MTEKSIFQEALARAPVERAAFLDETCAGQPELRASVAALLAAHDAAGVHDEPAATGSYTSQPEQPRPSAHADRLASTTDYTPAIEPGTGIAGRYTLVEKIGEGGMGEVWVAKQTEPVKHKVAIKLIKTGMDSKAVLQRFEQERQALALMDHPNIARILDGGITGNPIPEIRNPKQIQSTKSKIQNGTAGPVTGLRPIDAKRLNLTPCTDFALQ